MLTSEALYDSCPPIEVIEMPRPQPADVVARVEQALMLMQRQGWGVDKAAKFVKTDRRSVYRYLALRGIKWRKKGPLNQVFIQKPPKAKITDFLYHMAQGKSASKAAKEVKSTVRTMAKQTHDGKPIISKVGSRWKANFIPVYRHRLVVYGTMTGFTGKTLGRAQTPPQDAEGVQDDKLDKDYAEIWWQIDFDNFRSTLDTLQVGECHAHQIFELLKKQFETPSISNPTLVKSFQTDPRIKMDMAASGRGTSASGIELTKLESIFERYDLHFDDDYRWGVDDSAGLEPIGQYDVDSMGAKKFFQPQGKFQIVVLRKGRVDYYPETPIIVHYRFLVSEEDECRDYKSFNPI